MNTNIPKPFSGETPEQVAWRSENGVFLTPYKLPEATEQDRKMAWEILGRYVERPHPQTFGGGCIAFGRMLGASGEIEDIQRRANENADRLFYEKSKALFAYAEALESAVNCLILLPNDEQTQKRAKSIASQFEAFRKTPPLKSADSA